MTTETDLTRVVLGSERLLDSARLAGRRVGIVCNPASVDSEFRHIADRLAADPRARLGRDLRPAARVPIRRAGKHDRDRPRPRRDPAGAGVFALQRDARTDRRDAARPRRAGHRSAGRRHAHLHLHLHDGELPARRAPARREGDRLRSAESDRRRRGRGADARRRLRVVRRALSDSDAARHDDRRAGAAVQRALRHRRGARGRGDGGLAARMYSDADRRCPG